MILLVITNTSFGQLTIREKDLLEVVKSAIESKKLPRMLINNVDSSRAISLRESYDSTDRHYPLTVGIEGTEENELKTGTGFIQWGEVQFWIWDAEMFFVTDIYWLTPSNIEWQNDQVSFDFQTNSWTDKPIKYYRGRIKAKKKNNNWEIIKLKFIETKNTFDAWRRLREGNAR